METYYSHLVDNTGPVTQASPNRRVARKIVVHIGIRSTRPVFFLFLLGFSLRDSGPARGLPVRSGCINVSALLGEAVCCTAIAWSLAVTTDLSFAAGDARTYDSSPRFWDRKVIANIFVCTETELGICSSNRLLTGRYGRGHADRPLAAEFGGAASERREYAQGIFERLTVFVFSTYPYTNNQALREGGASVELSDVDSSKRSKGSMSAPSGVDS